MGGGRALWLKKLSRTCFQLPSAMHLTARGAGEREGEKEGERERERGGGSRIRIRRQTWRLSVIPSPTWTTVF